MYNIFKCRCYVWIISVAVAVVWIVSELNLVFVTQSILIFYINEIKQGVAKVITFRSTFTFHNTKKIVINIAHICQTIDFDVNEATINIVVSVL